MKSTVRHGGAVALALLLTGAAGASWAAPWPTPGSSDQQTEKFSKTVPLPKGGSLDIGNVSGDITVTGGAGDQVVIGAVKRGKTPEDLKALEIEVITIADRVQVRAQYPRERRNVNASVDFTVTVPRSAVVTAKSVSGGIKLSAIDGAARAETVSGDVTVSAAPKIESARTVSGSVSVDGSGSDTEVTVASVSGDVKLRAVKARGVDANSVSGDVTLDGVACERLQANSISGDLTFGGPLSRGGRYALQSHSGDVTVRVDGKAGFELNASTFSGDITSDVEIASTFGGESGRAGRGPRRGGPGQRVRGTFGDGGAFLEIDAFSGDVRIAGAAAAKSVK